LSDDTLGDGYVSSIRPNISTLRTDLGQILSISIYIQWGNQHEVPFGKRAIVYQGLADLERIIHEEATGKYIKRVQEESVEREEMLVMGKIPCMMRVNC
jgi:hypothetical protein